MLFAPQWINAACGQVWPSATGLPRVNWAHPLAYGLIWYHYPTRFSTGTDVNGRGGHMAEVVANSKNVYWFSGAPDVFEPATLWGPGGATCNQTVGCIDIPERVQIAEGGPYSWAGAFMRLSTTGHDCYIVHRGRGGGYSWNIIVRPGTGEDVKWFFTGYPISSNHSLYSGVSVQQDQLTSLVCTADGAGFGDGTATIYQNGIYANSVATNFGVDNGEAADNCFLPAGDGGDLRLFYFAMWDRALSASEANLLHWQPYCFLEPPNFEPMVLRGPAELALGDEVLDDGLSIVGDADKLYLCSALPTTYDEALSLALGVKDTGAGNLFGAPEAGSPGRKVTSASITGGEITANGTATHWAAVDSTTSPPRLLATGVLDADKVVADGEAFNLSPMTLHVTGT